MSDQVEAFLQRKRKNLEYFQEHLPRIFNIVKDMDPVRAELVVTPGQEDVDMSAEGHSCYKGHAKAYSVDEVKAFLEEHPRTEIIRSFPPSSAASFNQPRFASRLTKKAIQASPVDSQNCQGYVRGKAFPFIMFLGCGLGYHIEAFLERTDVINAVVVEREPEKFVLSLFTVDWARIISKFKSKGYSISFAINFEENGEDFEQYLNKYLAYYLPVYPLLAQSYNHLADIELAKLMSRAAEHIVVMAAHWNNYDDELRRFRNTLHNVKQGIRYLTSTPETPNTLPCVVVGSGPSIDNRLESLKAFRDRVVVVSAGTGLRALLTNGIRPDFHVELDPGYLVYQYHNDMSENAREMLKETVLLANNEVNPLVPGLFGKTYYFFKKDNNIPGILRTVDGAFRHCNPTCTNAALALSWTLGFREFYLFGTDYGFESIEQNHAKDSIYGSDTKTGFARKVQSNSGLKKRQQFRVPSVSGGSVLTTNDYLAAKHAVEETVAALNDEAGITIFNCSDGARIEGVDWLSNDDFSSRVSSNVATGDTDWGLAFAARSCYVSEESLENELTPLIQILEGKCKKVLKLLKRAKLAGRKDLVILANELRIEANIVKSDPTPEVGNRQAYVYQLIRGSILHFVYAGLSHGMACGDAQLLPFLKKWRATFSEFLTTAPKHFASHATLSLPAPEADPWVTSNISEPEPEL